MDVYMKEPEEELPEGLPAEVPGEAPEPEAEETGLDIMVPGVDDGVDGVDPSVGERMEAGLQDTLDLRDWKMPSVRDYFWYIFVYTVLIVLAVQVIYRYRMLWAYVLWGSYLVTMLVLAGLIVRSMSYRRGTYSKGFTLSTLELQRAIEDALEAEGLPLDRMEQPPGAFLRPMIAVYHLDRVGFTVSVEGRSHLKRKVVRVGRFADGHERERGRAFIDSLDGQAEKVTSGRRSRSLFQEEGAY
jgi:hypothetical protein